ncbi:hypothetical protein NMY22_g3609 [Coprinellus aureogranulatus]|nr:hypothetical protein NMY22_g3609 [Coprinellus aureogranulatus]
MINAKMFLRRLQCLNHLLPRLQPRSQQPLTLLHPSQPHPRPPQLAHPHDDTNTSQLKLICPTRPPQIGISRRGEGGGVSVDAGVGWAQILTCYEGRERERRGQNSVCSIPLPFSSILFRFYSFHFYPYACSHVKPQFHHRIKNPPPPPLPPGPRQLGQNCALEQDVSVPVFDNEDILYQSDRYGAMRRRSVMRLRAPRGIRMTLLRPRDSLLVSGRIIHHLRRVMESRDADQTDGSGATSTTSTLAEGGGEETTDRERGSADSRAGTVDGRAPNRRNRHLGVG